MSRTKGSKNKPKPVTDGAFHYTLDQRLQMIADLIIEKIKEDQSFKQNIAKIITIDTVRVEDVTDQQ